MLDWFVARLGYIAFTGNYSTEFPNTATSKTETITTFFAPSQRGATVGVGFRFGGFSLDATVNEDVLRQAEDHGKHDTDKEQEDHLTGRHSQRRHRV